MSWEGCAYVVDFLLKYAVVAQLYLILKEAQFINQNLARLYSGIQSFQRGKEL